MITYGEMLLDDWEVRYAAGNRITLTRDGWIACINKATGLMSIFDPAGVSVVPPDHYSMKALEEARWRCKLCKKTADQLETVAFVRGHCVPCHLKIVALLG